MFAQVALNVPVDQAFDYRVPPALEGALAPGHLVQVPFRTAQEYGIVLSLSSTPPPFQTKTILARVDPQPVVSAREIALARWLRAAKLAPIGFCLWLWVPHGLTSHSDTQYRLLLSAPEAEAAARTPLEKAVVALLARRGALRSRQLDISFAGDPWRTAADALVRAGVLDRQAVLAAPRVRPRVIETAARAIHPRNIEQAAEAVAKPSRTANLLEVLAEHPKDKLPLRETLRRRAATRRHAHPLPLRGGAAVDSEDRLMLTMWPEDVPALLSELRRTETALRVLRVLARTGGPMEVSWVYAQTGADINDLRRLEEAELIWLGDKREYRDSLADQHFLPAAPPALTRAQRAAFAPVQRALDAREAKCFLLHGVTGSGKTEIYLRAIAHALDQGRSAIFLVPEIALTPQTVRRVAGRFPGQVALVHSGLSESERYDTWRRARDGLVRIVVGARSALFTPLQDIGVIILDEEHDGSYKHSPPMPPPYYDARHLAEACAQHDGAVVILGSATPDVETMYRSDLGEITRLALPDRIMGHRQRISDQAQDAHVATRYEPADDDALMIGLPPVDVIDMREELKAGNARMFSRALGRALRDTLARKEQAILFLNRRGQATYVFCRDCGFVVRCPRCDTTLTYHRHGQMLRCHRCDYAAPEPTLCPSCHSQRIRYFGAGTQQVEQAVVEAFPAARMLRWDADTASTQASHDAILQRFMHRQADVLVGTQMIAKGLDLPMVTLVGVISADVGLNLPDFRAGERTFQVLTQVAGRAGRGLLGGRVILQTYQPEHYTIQSAARHDYTRFYAHEIAYRREFGYPPFRRMVRVLLRFPSESQARSQAEQAAALLSRRIAEMDLRGCELIGPAPCFFSRENDMHRWHVLVRGPDPLPAFRGLNPPQGWYIDVDPLDVL